MQVDFGKNAQNLFEVPQNVEIAKFSEVEPRSFEDFPQKNWIS